MDNPNKIKNTNPIENDRGSKWAQLGAEVPYNEQRAQMLALDLKYGNGNKSGDELFTEYKEQGVTEQPSRIEKARRRVLDALGIKSAKLEEQRDREAMPEAIKLHQQYLAKMEDSYKTGLTQEAVRKAEEARAEEINKTADEIAGIINDQSPTTPVEMSFTKKTDERLWVNSYNKHLSAQKERAREIVEKDLNARLTKIEDLLVDAESGDGANLAESDYMGKKVQIINMTGHPLTMLSHTIDYKRDSLVDYGKGISGAVVVQPALWSQRKDQFPTKQFGSSDAYSINDNISMSYTNIEKNPTQAVIDTRFGKYKTPYLVYGFDHVEANTLERLTDRDGNNPKLTDGANKITEKDFGFFDMVENSGSKSYNEVLVSRYSETGVPKKPDFIVAENGNITKDMLIHASYHGVPIVNIERKYYSSSETDA